MFHGTTIVCVRRGTKVAMAGDGQVTFGATVLKRNARKVRRLKGGEVLAGFAGSTADAFTLLERFEGKLEAHRGNLQRAAVELAKDWRTDRFLRRLEAKNGRAQILWCTENDCSELPVTRDAELYLAAMGNDRSDGRTKAWLRDKSGAVLSCAQPEEGVSDQLACEKTKLLLSDFPAVAVAQPARPPAPAPAPAPQSSTTDADRNNLSAAIDRAIAAGDFATADRLLVDATRRYAGYAAWPALQQKLAKGRADRDAQLHYAEAHRLIAEARRFAQTGDFNHAETMLQDAEKQIPGFAETAQARTEIASLRTERGQHYRERTHYYAAIDQALAADQLWEAERLLAEYAQRFAQDGEYRARADRLAQLRSDDRQKAKVNQARTDIQLARQAAERGDFAEADRQLALADRAAPGFPEVAQARADLSRRRGLTIQIPNMPQIDIPIPQQAPRN